MDTADGNIAEKYWNDLFRYSKTERGRGDPPISDFQDLHVMNIAHLQNQLVLLKSEMERTQTTTDDQMGMLQKTLRQYGETIHR